MRKQLTPQQIAARDERRAKLRALWKTIKAMSDDQRIALANKFGIRTVEGRELSFCNQCLIAMQHPAPSVVGGFRQWLEQGRAVRKGEHGLGIWVPIGKGKGATPFEEPAAEHGNADGDKPGFIFGSVFDISQTCEIQSGRYDALAESKNNGFPHVEINPRSTPQNCEVVC